MEVKKSNHSILPNATHLIYRTAFINQTVLLKSHVLFNIVLLQGCKHGILIILNVVLIILKKLFCVTLIMYVSVSVI